MKLYAHRVLQSSSSGNALAVQALTRCSTMINIIYNEADISAVRCWRSQHPDPRVLVRMEPSPGAVKAWPMLRSCGCVGFPQPVFIAISRHTWPAGSHS
jgi:hypothetical protein